MVEMKAPGSEDPSYVTCLPGSFLLIDLAFTK